MLRCSYSDPSTFADSQGKSCEHQEHQYLDSTADNIFHGKDPFIAVQMLLLHMSLSVKQMPTRVAAAVMASTSIPLDRK